MTVYRDPVAGAERVRTRRQAARMAAAIEPELALNDELTPQQEVAHERALQLLRERHPDLEHDDAYTEGPRSQSAGLKRAFERGGPAASRTASRARRARNHPATRAAGRSAGAARRQAARAAAPVAQSTAGQAAGDASGLFWDFLTSGIVLSIVYLLIASPNGPRATSGALAGIARAFKWLASPGPPAAPPTVLEFGTAVQQGNQAQIRAATNAQVRRKTLAGLPGVLGGTAPNLGVDPRSPFSPQHPIPVPANALLGGGL